MVRSQLGLTHHCRECCLVGYAPMLKRPSATTPRASFRFIFADGPRVGKHVDALGAGLTIVVEVTGTTIAHPSVAALSDWEAPAADAGAVAATHATERSHADVSVTERVSIGVVRHLPAGVVEVDILKLAGCAVHGWGAVLAAEIRPHRRVLGHDRVTDSVRIHTC